jgi:ribosomal protein S6E (S10)
MQFEKKLTGWTTGREVPGTPFVLSIGDTYAGVVCLEIRGGWDCTGVALELDAVEEVIEALRAAVKQIEES